MTEAGGEFGYGTVFELSPNGSGGWNETVLHSFTNGADGGNPIYAYVIFDKMGNLYGTASAGGASKGGVVFELSPAGGTWTETVLYSFDPLNQAHGVNPISGLAMDAAGNLYGSTQSGGEWENGVVFELSPSDGSWTEQYILSYMPSSSNQAGVTVDASGNIFLIDQGTQVYELSPNGEGGWTSTLIFEGSPLKVGSELYGTLALDTAGNVYGTSLNGGTKNRGTVFKLNHSKKGTWTFKVLYSFHGGKEIGGPFGGVVLDAGGNIFGTTVGGENGSNAGAVFELEAPIEKGGYKEEVLWNFNGTDGEWPYGSLIMDSAGNLYGTTYKGGDGYGVVFEVNLSGVVTTTTTTLASSPNLSIY